MQIRERIMSAIYYICDIIDEKVWNLLSYKFSHALVLMYHNVTDEQMEQCRSCVHTISEFTNTLLRLKNDGYAFVSIDDCINNNYIGMTKMVSVTFDDVPDNFYTNAYPILKRENIPFTLFVADKFIDTPGFLTGKQLQILSKDILCTIGAHTISHQQLSKTKNSLEEMRLSKNKLEELLERDVEYLAYPYGKHSSINHKIMYQAKKIGFKRAFGTINAPITYFTRNFKFYLPRVVLHQ